ncbi:homeobox protein vex1-like [Pristis pectinata]|uniref:homeobox protein vex1-like n=1 Tax=Pristis pectinata TaxID=685728 RepID=UPI00223D72C5|nr:homeobox protein vex1-like [Pristis pectinata]
MSEHIHSSMSHKYPGIRKQPRISILKMLEAAFSVEWLAQSSQSGEKGQNECSKVLRCGRAAGHDDLCTAERSHGKETASSTEERGRSPARHNQRAKPQQRALAVRASAACSSSASGSAQWADRRRLRTIFTMDQVRMLERSFQRQQYPGTFVRRSLAGELRLSETQIKTWFQNRRMKLKQQLQVAQAEALKSRLFLQYFCHPYHSVHSLHHVVDSSFFPHYPEFGPLPTQTSISDCCLRHLDYQPNLPLITPKATTSRLHPHLTI